MKTVSRRLAAMVPRPGVAVTALAAVSGFAVSGFAVPGADLWAQTPSLSVELTGRMQFQFNTTSVEPLEIDGPLAGSTFETRRVRLGARISLDDWVHGFIEPEFALGELRLRQVWMSLEFDGGFLVRAGQFKKPFSLIHLTSSASHPMIERGVRIRGLTDVLALENDGELSELRGALLIGEHFALLEAQGYLAYDMGVAIEGVHSGFGWSAGVFNGNGPDARDENDGKSLAARMTYRMDVGIPLTLGGAWSRRELNWPTQDGPDTRAGVALEIDAELGGFRRGWWLLAELATGTNLATEGRFFGAQGVLSYFHRTRSGRVEGIEPMARVSWADPDDGIDDNSGMLLTPGLNVYFMGRNRLMFNWDVYVPGGEQFTTQNAGRAQVNLFF